MNFSDHKHFHAIGSFQLDAQVIAEHLDARDWLV
jgi:hypothetical protein